ncbi:hypothetical protein Q8A73_016890 [Channa argus]|nr:hypothetical protein Q8A73_016890 [Channa argus]
METLPPMPAGGNAERARGPCCCYTLLWRAALFGQLSWLTKRNCKKTKTKGAYREAATKSAGVERRLHCSQRHCKARSMRGVNGASPFSSSRPRSDDPHSLLPEPTSSDTSQVSRCSIVNSRLARRSISQAAPISLTPPRPFGRANQIADRLRSCLFQAG